MDLNQTQPCLSYWLRLIKDTKVCLCGMACRLITTGKHETFRFYCRSVFQIHVFCHVAFSYLYQASKTYLPQLQKSSHKVMPSCCFINITSLSISCFEITHDLKTDAVTTLVKTACSPLSCCTVSPATWAHTSLARQPTEPVH